MLAIHACKQAVANYDHMLQGKHNDTGCFVGAVIEKSSLLQQVLQVLLLGTKAGHFGETIPCRLWVRLGHLQALLTAWGQGEAEHRLHYSPSREHRQWKPCLEGSAVLLALHQRIHQPTLFMWSTHVFTCSPQVDVGSIPRHTYVRSQQYTDGKDPSPGSLHVLIIIPSSAGLASLHSTEKKPQIKSGPCRHGRPYPEVSLLHS